MAVEKKVRIDQCLVERGLAPSRAKAQAMVMAGVVIVNDRRVERSSEAVHPDDQIRVKGESAASRYVGRGGLKLEAALDAWKIDPDGWNCIDIGSSTGGFTDCLLQRGALKVTAVDSGTNQLDWRLRKDPRVKVMERTNARTLSPQDVDGPFDLAVMDVSFISVTKIIPNLMSLLKKNGKLIVLIKPQFEVGKGEVGKGGIVREPEKHARVVKEVTEFAVSLGLSAEGMIESPIMGAEGNREFLALYERN
ncbi:MAG: TlyA family RNA methyltransferase [Pyrinomonadaceae bacterium]|nr:TlyA family RNA methyltransferase [Pyrinomonadaceae bacterium]